MIFKSYDTIWPLSPPSPLKALQVRHQLGSATEETRQGLKNNLPLQVTTWSYIIICNIISLAFSQKKATFVQISNQSSNSKKLKT